MVNEIQSFLRARRLTSQFLLGFLQDDSEIGNLVGAGRLFIWPGEGKEVEFIAFISPGRRLHVQGSISGINLDKLRSIVEKFDLVGMNGPSSLVAQVLSIGLTLGLKSSRKQFDELVFLLELPTSIQRTGSSQENPVGLAPNERLGLLLAKDFESWHALYLEYLQEMEITAQATIEDRRSRFYSEVAQKHHWGLWVGDRLVSIAAFISKFGQSAQIGGVYTVPEFRRAKYAKKVFGRLLNDAIQEHRMSEMFLFTGENDHGPRALYEGFGFVPKEKYTLIEFEDKPA